MVHQLIGGRCVGLHSPTALVFFEQSSEHASGTGLKTLNLLQSRYPEYYQRNARTP